MTKVRDVAAGPMRLRSRWLKAKSREKKLSARQMTPTPNRPLVTTAAAAPRIPLR
ncbi:MAG: hypothetical protein WBD98_19755 [Acidobacteriaceae bacterium]